MPDSASPPPDRERMCNALRALAMDAVQRASSGHPGMPMGMAEIALAPWHRHLSHNPADPQWFNRDRSVPSTCEPSQLPRKDLDVARECTGFYTGKEEASARLKAGGRRSEWGRGDRIRGAAAATLAILRHFAALNLRLAAASNPACGGVGGSGPADRATCRRE